LNSRAVKRPRSIGKSTNQRTLENTRSISKRPRESGSVTIEAAVIMPVFICVIVSIVFFVRVVFIQELIRRATVETAEEIAAFSYLVYKPGLDDKLHDWLVEGFGKSLSDPGTGKDGMAGQDERTGKILDAIKNAVVEKAAENAEGYMLMPLAHMLAGRHLSDCHGDRGYLEKLGVVGGYDGLDFSGSSFCAGETDDINIIIRYSVRIPVPLRLFGDLHFEQRACARAWMGGDNPSDREEDIWSLDNLTRGKKVREIFGANLPWGFPGISSLKNGCAILIRSMDITAATYQNPENIERTVNGYIDDLAEYNGQVKPWGSEKKVILPEDIHSRKLLLVIPSNPVGDSTLNALDSCRIYAAGRGVMLEVRKYGYKKDRGEPDDK
jgi:hypothetical protein